MLNIVFVLLPVKTKTSLNLLIKRRLYPKRDLNPHSREAKGF